MPASPDPAASGAARTGRWQRWPGQCAICRGWGVGRVCADCLSRYAAAMPRCSRCAIGVPAGIATCGRCLLRPPPHDAALAAVDYGYPWDGLIARFKFDAALDLAGALSDLLLLAWQRDGQRHPGLLLPVPLSDRRLRERGYNQAWELTRRIARAVHAPADARLLLSVRDTPHQIDLPPARRAANVRGAYAVEPLRAGELRARHVTLIDDVMTTGATLGEAAAVVRQAGATSVDVWAIARTPVPLPAPP